MDAEMIVAIIVGISVMAFAWWVNREYRKTKRGRGGGFPGGGDGGNGGNGGGNGG